MPAQVHAAEDADHLVEAYTDLPSGKLAIHGGTQIGTPMEPDNLRRSWGRIRTAAGLAGTRFHDIRHTSVSLLLHLGVAPCLVPDPDDPGPATHAADGDLALLQVEVGAAGVVRVAADPGQFAGPDPARLIDRPAVGLDHGGLVLNVFIRAASAPANGGWPPSPARSGCPARPGRRAVPAAFPLADARLEFSATRMRT